MFAESAQSRVPSLPPAAAAVPSFARRQDGHSEFLRSLRHPGHGFLPESDFCRRGCLFLVCVPGAGSTARVHLPFGSSWRAIMLLFVFPFFTFHRTTRKTPSSEKPPVGPRPTRVHGSCLLAGTPGRTAEKLVQSVNRGLCPRGSCPPVEQTGLLCTEPKGKARQSISISKWKVTHVTFRRSPRL